MKKRTRRIVGELADVVSPTRLTRFIAANRLVVFLAPLRAAALSEGRRTRGVGGGVARGLYSAEGVWKWTVNSEPRLASSPAQAARHSLRNLPGGHCWQSLLWQAEWAVRAGGVRALVRATASAGKMPPGPR